VEHPFEVELDGWKLRGIIDRIDHVDGMAGNGAGWRIVDYKTGRPIARAKRDLQVELYALAASAVGGCESCVRSHERVVLEGGLTEEQVHDAVRIAATIHAAAIALEVA
jgi:AhpD family alkylhydroperoxidase